MNRIVTKTVDALSRFGERLERRLSTGGDDNCNLERVDSDFMCLNSGSALDYSLNNIPASFGACYGYQRPPMCDLYAGGMTRPPYGPGISHHMNYDYRGVCHGPLPTTPYGNVHGHIGYAPDYYIAERRQVDLIPAPPPRYIQQPVPVPLPVDRPVPQPYPVEVSRPVPVDRPVPVPVLVPVPIPSAVPVDRPVPVPIGVPVPSPPVQVPIPVPVDRPVPQPYPVEVSRPVPVDRPVPVPIGVPVRSPQVQVPVPVPSQVPCFVPVGVPVPSPPPSPALVENSVCHTERWVTGSPVMMHRQRSLAGSPVMGVNPCNTSYGRPPCMH
ncbi:unnamed protein product [Rotaria sp. Silwood2]|nr:unnamed protein product [Rotaria sp. Silwood2]CAF4354228.1 unnamed protein product [Rotaria sp. Silwood2]